MGGKSPPTTTSTTKQTLSPEAQELFNLALPSITQHANSPLPNYTGSTVAGFTPEQLQAQEAFLSAIPGATDLGSRAAESQRFLLSTDQLDPNSNPYASAIADQITGKIQTGLVEKTLPVIRAGGIQAGGMFGGGSTRQQLAEGRAVGDAAEATGDALSQFYSNNYQAGLNNIARAQQLNPSIQAQQLFGANVLDAVGGQKQALEQALTNEALQKWITETYGPYFRSSELLSLLGALPNTGTVTATNQGALPRANPLTGGLGGAASGAAIGSIVPGVGTGLGAILGGLAGVGSTYL